MTKWPLLNQDNVFVTLIVYLVCVVAICQVPNTPTYRSLIFKNIGIKLCQLKCVENGFCRSIEYTISTLTCHLSEMDHDSVMNEAQHFIGSKDFADVQAGSCPMRTCPNMRCLETRSGKTECVKEKWKHTKLDTILVDACIVGDLARVKFILSDGRANINSIGKDNMTPVMHAANEGHKKVFDLLVREGATLSLLDRKDRNILHLASIGGNVEIVQYVLTQNIMDINSREKDGLTPAMNAALYKRKDVFDILVEAGADLLLVNDFKQTILHVACEGGNIEIMKYLMKQDILDIESRDLKGWTPLMQGARSGHKDVFDILVKAGADLSQVGNEEDTILHVACRGGNIEIVKYLMKQDTVDIDSRDADGWTPVMQAASAGHGNVFNFLVEKGADLSHVTNEADTILHVACEGGNIETVKYLMKQNTVDIDSRDADGFTPVMKAASAGHGNVFNFLVEKGADLSHVSNDKESILHVVCDGGTVEMTKYLLKHSIVDIDSRDIKGETPAMYAAYAGHKDMFDILVEAGADLSLVSYEKQNILHMACVGGSVQIIKYLLKHAIVDFESRDKNGWTPVMTAASVGHKDVFDILVEAGADLSKVGNKKETILHVACTRGSVEIVKYLLTYDIVDIDSRDEDGLTPVLHTAIDKSNEVFDILVKCGAELSLVDEDNNSILHLACHGNSVEIVKYLLTHNIVDINSRNGEDCTPAMIAARDGHEAIFFLVVENEADLTIASDAEDNILSMACKGGNINIVKYVSTQHIVEGPYRVDDPC